MTYNAWKCVRVHECAITAALRGNVKSCKMNMDNNTLMFFTEIV